LKAFPKVGLLALAALLAAAAMATSAQAAITINPAGVAVSGTASNFTLTYGAITVRCDTGTLAGNTTNPASDGISNLSPAFFGNCVVEGVGPATVSCQGTVTVIATDNRGPTDNPGTLVLNSGFTCVVTTAICTLTFSGPQTTQPEDVNLNEDTDVLSVNGNVAVTRTGSVACGPAWGAGTFRADYATTPPTLTFEGTP
jgi:hypothetical protein